MSSSSVLEQFCGLSLAQGLTQHVITVVSLGLLFADVTPSFAESQKSQTGVASVYSTDSGRKTASGQRLKPSTVTAAHRTLPFGTKVRVTNKANGRSVVVMINDRGPFIRGRIIDVTPAAAKALGFSGITSVAIDV